LILPGIACSQEHVADVAAINGTLYVQGANSSEWTQASEKMPLYLDDKLKTEANSYADIVFLTGGQVAINQNTTIQITGITDVADVSERSFIQNIIITSGEIWAKITQQQQEIQFQTKGGVVAIKGTEFVIEENPDTGETSVSVLEGTIVFRGLDAKETLYDAGKHVRMALDSISVNEYVPEELKKHLQDRLGNFGEFVETIMKQVDETLRQANQTVEQANQTVEQANQTVEQANQTVYNANQNVYNANQTLNNLNINTGQYNYTPRGGDNSISCMYPGGTVPLSGFNFTWMDLSSLPNYRLVVADNKELKNPVIVEICQGSTYTPPENIMSSLCFGKTYYWYIEGLDNNNNSVGKNSEVREFLIQNY